MQLWTHKCRRAFSCNSSIPVAKLELFLNILVAELVLFLNIPVGALVLVFKHCYHRNIISYRSRRH